MFSIYLLTAELFTSCYSYKIFPAEYRSFEHKGEEELAFVINPELKRECKILDQSGIFKITADSLNEKCIKVRLYPISKRLVCGNPIIASALTLGQLPVYFPDKVYYHFEEIRGNDTTAKNFELHVAQRIWFWDMFTMNKNFDEKAGKALLASYYKK